MRKLLPLYLAVAACLPGVLCSLASIHLPPPATAAVSGLAILSASFLLLWACDVAQNDIPQALALAVGGTNLFTVRAKTALSTLTVTGEALGKTCANFPELRPALLTALGWVRTGEWVPGNFPDAGPGWQTTIRPAGGVA